MSLGETDITLAPIPINFENIRLLTLLSDEVSVNINTKHGVIIINTAINTTKLSYVITSLTQ